MKKVLSMLLAIVIAISVMSGISLSSYAISYETEDNGSFTKANVIQVNNECCGYAYDYEDDYYKFSLSHNGYISIELDHDELDNGGWDLHLYNSDKERMYHWCVYASETKAFKTEHIGLPAGTYYVVVEATDPIYGLGGAETDYYLKVNYTQSSVWEAEDNGSFVKSNIVSLNKKYYGYAYDYEWDYYKFTLSSKTIVSITFSHGELDDGGWDFYLYNSDKKEMYDWRVYASETKTFKTEKLNLTAGTYYFVVVASDPIYGPGGAKTDYSFKIGYEGFRTIDGKTYYYNNGVAYKSRLISVAGKKYYMGADGAMYTNRLISVNGKKYYMGADGAAYTNRFVTVNGKKYYMDKNGVAYTNRFISVNGKKYYMDKTGAAYTNRFISVSGKKYYMDKTGAAYTNRLISVNGKKYYMGKDGVAFKNKFVSLSGKKYYFGSDCIMYKSKSFSINGVKWRADSAGVCKKV